MLRRDMELHRVTSHALGCPAGFRAMPWRDRKTTSKGWRAYVEGAGDRDAVARRGRRTVVGAERAGTPVELADGNGGLPRRIGVLRRWTPGMMKPPTAKGNAHRGRWPASSPIANCHIRVWLPFGRLRSKPLINMASNR